MCGICGICDSNGLDPSARTAVGRMNDSIAHRGPDGAGFFDDAHVALGHRRLSIIDLDGGAQPMHNEDGRLTIVFNGEIYNYIELREPLRDRHTFATSTDTEVILHLYEEWGDDCVESLNGMFAFALWDASQRRLLLARDRLGEKPLYYYHDSVRGRLMFASELKALITHPDLQREVDVSALDDYLAYGYVPADRCILKGVAKLPPGHRLVYHNGQCTVTRYWDVQFQEGAPPGDDAFFEELDHRIRESIRIRLRSDVPLGVFLSGGVDSSAVVALASAALEGQPVKTFSIGFGESDYDELAFAGQVARHYRTDHQELVVADTDIDVLPELAYHLDEPFADPSALPTYYVCREARRFVTVCLSGDGGDELFAGYSRYLQAERARRFDPLTRAGVGALCGVLARAVPRHVRGRGVLERLSTSGAARYFAQCCKFPFDERRGLLRADVREHAKQQPWLFEPFFVDRNGTPLVSVLQHVDQKTYLPDDILVKVDRMSMKNSLEVRVPFLDHTLVEFANQAPVSLKLRDGITKYALKQVLAAKLPANLLHRPKMGFGIPIKHWFRGTLDGYARDVLLGADARATQWLDRAAIAGVIDDHQRGRRDLSRRIWALLVLELWCRRFGV